MRSLTRLLLSLLPLVAIVGVVGCSVLGPSDVDFIAAVDGGDRQKAERLHRRGVRFSKQGKPDKAEVAFHNALVADESYGPALNNIGRLYYEKGDLYSAAWSFERAMKSLPERPEPANNLGMTFEKAGRFDEAIQMYEIAWGLEQSNPEFLGNLVRTKLRRGDGDYSIFEELQELVFIETRPEWRVFAQQQLTMLLRANETEPGELSTDGADEAADAMEMLPAPIYGAPLSE
jgi:Flp pilus assembly protein TadD